MKQTTIRVATALLALTMVLSMMVVLPLSVSAAEASSTNPHTEVWGAYTENKGVALPEGATSYSGTPATGFAGGTGTVNDPYQISNAEEFMYFRETEVPSGATAGKYYALTGNIYLNNASFSTAKKLTAPTGDFAGVLDGGGKAIYNAYCKDQSNSANYKVALLNKVSGTVKNLNIVGAYLQTYRNSTGALALVLTGTVDNVHVVGMTTARRGNATDADSAGGIAALAGTGATITNCTVSGLIKSTDSDNTYSGAGGIIGATETEASNITISDCVNYATIAITGKFTHSGGYLKGCAAGGIVGRFERVSNCAVINCENRGVVKTTATGVIGGIVGVADRQTGVIAIQNCINYIDLVAGSTAPSAIGGILGCDAGGSIEIDECINYGNLTSADTQTGAGGILGRVTADNPVANTTITDCVNNGDVTCGMFAGGVLGYFEKLTNPCCVDIRSTVNNGDVRAIAVTSEDGATVTGGRYAGGMFGGDLYDDTVKAGKPDVYNCASYGSVTADVSHAGYIAGYAVTGYRGIADVSVYGFMATGGVSAPAYAGALFGQVGMGYGSGSIAVHLQEIWVEGPVSPVTLADADGAAVTNCAALFGTAETALKKLSTCTNVNVAIDGMTTVGYYLISGDVNTVKTTTGTTTSATALTDGTATTSLNAYVKTNNGTEGAVQMVPWAQEKNAPTLLTTLDISGAGMTLGGSMSLNMMIDASVFTGVDNLTSVQFASLDEGIGTKTVTEITEGYYKAPYTISAADMTKDLQLYAIVNIGGTEYKSVNVLTYSPADYITRMHAKETTSAEVKTVLEAMVGYGVAAEAKAYGTTALATATAGIASPVWKEGYTDHIGEGALTDADKAVINIAAPGGVGASLAGGITLELKNMTPGAEMTLVGGNINKTYKADDAGTIVISDLHAGMIRTRMQMTFANGTASFTIGNFLDGRNSGDEAALVQATILYMMAVREYVLTNQANA